MYSRNNVLLLMPIASVAKRPPRSLQKIQYDGPMQRNRVEIDYVRTEYRILFLAHSFS